MRMAGCARLLLLAATMMVSTQLMAAFAEGDACIALTASYMVTLSRLPGLAEQASVAQNIHSFVTTRAVSAPSTARARCSCLNAVLL